MTGYSSKLQMPHHRMLLSVLPKETSDVLIPPPADEIIKSCWYCKVPSLSLPLSFSLSLSIRSFRLSLLVGPLDSIQWPYRADVRKSYRFILARTYVKVNRKTPLMNWFLLLQQLQACFVCLTWMVYEMGGKWTFSCCFVECCFQDLFKTTHRVLV